MNWDDANQIAGGADRQYLVEWLSRLAPVPTQVRFGEQTSIAPDDPGVRDLIHTHLHVRGEEPAVTYRPGTFDAGALCERGIAVVV